MRQLYELSTAKNKYWKAFPGGDHNSSVLEEGYFEAVAEFVLGVAHQPADTLSDKEA